MTNDVKYRMHPFTKHNCEELNFTIGLNIIFMESQISEIGKQNKQDDTNLWIWDSCLA